jgi:hypothetical protein
MVDVLSSRPVTKEALVQYQATSCVVYDGKSDAGAGVSPSTWVVSCQYHLSVLCARIVFIFY